jgi:hypothetical protein
MLRHSDYSHQGIGTHRLSIVEFTYDLLLEDIAIEPITNSECLKPGVNRILYTIVFSLGILLDVIPPEPPSIGVRMTPFVKRHPNLVPLAELPHRCPALVECGEPYIT